MFKKIKAPSVLKNIFSIILVIVGVIPFYLNPHASTEHIYGGQLYFIPTLRKWSCLGIFLLLSYILLIIAILFCLLSIKKKFAQYNFPE